MARKASEKEIRELKRERGPELMRRYGAHAVGVGHKTVGGERTADLALVFYVERKGDTEHPVPSTLELGGNGGGEPVEVATDVVESPRAQLEVP
jgi:hypothetical protein